jgi:hypothetical protein
MVDRLNASFNKLLKAIIENGPYLAAAAVVIFIVYFIIMTIYRLIGLCDALLFGHDWGF